jgi:hypothetical protein
MAASELEMDVVTVVEYDGTDDRDGGREEKFGPIKRPRISLYKVR